MKTVHLPPPLKYFEIRVGAHWCALAMLLLFSTIGPATAASEILTRAAAPSHQEWQMASNNFGDALQDMLIARINPKALKTVEWSQGAQKIQRTLDSESIAGHQFSLPLPGRTALVTLQVNALLENKGVHTYSGTLDKQQETWFSISWDGENMLGFIHAPGAIYVIQPLKSQPGQVSVSKINPARIPQDPDDTKYDTASGNVTNPTATAAGRNVIGTGHVKVLFLYAADVNYANLFANAIVADMNAALQRSGVASNNYISLAGLKYIPSTFGNQCKSFIRDKMRDRVNEFAHIDQDLAAYNADIALLLIKGRLDQPGDTSPYCRVGGIAYLAYPNHSERPFAVSADSYALADKTAIHEIGHVFGGGHPAWTSGQTTWARGYLDSAGNFQTVMGSYDGGVVSPPVPQCVFNSDGTIPETCPRIGHFSNPAVTYNGWPTGTPYHNMKYWLDDFGVMKTVSAWRENAPSAPDAPSLSAQSELCYGLYTISWTSQSSATHYRLFWSSSNYSGNASEVYNGNSTSTIVDVPGTRYLWVKACNSYGCSPFSNRVSATSLNTCI